MFEHEKEVVWRWLKVLGGTRADIWTSIVEHWHEDASWTLIGRTARSGVFKGFESMKNDFFELGRTGDGRPGPSVQGLSSDYGVTMNIKEVVALEDGRICVFATSNAMGRNGVAYDNEYCFVVTVRGDKIAGLYEYCDTVAIEEAHFDKKLVPRGTETPVYER